MNITYREKQNLKIPLKFLIQKKNPYPAKSLWCDGVSRIEASQIKLSSAKPCSAACAVVWVSAWCAPPALPPKQHQSSQGLGWGSTKSYKPSTNLHFLLSHYSRVRWTCRWEQSQNSCVGFPSANGWAFLTQSQELMARAGQMFAETSLGTPWEVG